MDMGRIRSACIIQFLNLKRRDDSEDIGADAKKNSNVAVVAYVNGVKKSMSLSGVVV
jgi:hypothetical protein